MSTHTIRLHRVLRCPPEKVYRAFLDADAMAKWLPPHGFTGRVHHSDAKVGGTFRMSFRNFSTGHSNAFGGSYLELNVLTADERERFRRGPPQAEPAGVPAVIPEEACYLGWQESLNQLAHLVEPDIPNG